jgi:hypothetical protein
MKKLIKGVLLRIRGEMPMTKMKIAGRNVGDNYDSRISQI